MKLKETLMLAIAALAFMLITGVAKSEEVKTITPQEFASNVAQVPGKLVKFIGNEVDKTKEYQANSWAEMKTKWPFTMFTGNKDESQN